MTGPKRAGRPGGISSIGLTGAPAAAAPVAPAPVSPSPAPVPPQQVKEDVSSRRREPVTSEARARFSAPPATADTTSSYTLRMHVDDADEVDELRKRMRRRTGRRSIDQAEIIRVLLRLAIDDAAVRGALLSELTKS